MLQINHHTVLTYSEATQTKLQNEQKKLKEKPYGILTKNERLSTKVGTAVITDVKYCIKEV